MSNKAQEERLIKLAEECGEAIQIIMKILQYGYEEHYPGDPYNNRQRLENEIRDIFFWLNQMSDSCDINLYDALNRMDQKLDKAAQYTQYQAWSKWKSA